VTRKGGLAGLTLAADLEVDDRIARTLERLASGGPPHPDGFEYRFDLPSGPLTVAEQELPRELDPLLDEFQAKAKPGA
jgi:hypothetical protein